MRYDQILVAVDLTRDISRLLQRAGKLAQRLGARLHLLAVLPLDESHSGLVGDPKLLRLKQESLEFINRQIVGLPCPLGECRIESGPVAEQILRTMQELACDLLIMGQHHEESLLLELRAPLVNSLLPRHRHDLLLLDSDRPFWGQPLKFQLALELNEVGLGLLHRAEALSRRLGAELTALHVQGEALEGAGTPDAEIIESERQRAEHQLADWLARLPRAPRRWQVVRGDVRELLRQALLSTQHHLLIVGAGKSEHPQLSMGSHLHALLQQHGGDLLILH